MSSIHEQGSALPPYEMQVINDSPLTLLCRMVYPTIIRFDFQQGGGLGFGEAQIPGINKPGVVFHNSSGKPVQIAIESGGPQPHAQNVVIEPNPNQDKVVLLGHSATFGILFEEYPDEAHSRVIITIQPPAQG